MHVCSVVSDSLWPQGWQHSRLPRPWGFSGQEHWSGLPFSPPGNLPDPGAEKGLPRWQSSKEPACQCRRLQFNCWVRKIPCRRECKPIPEFLPGKSHGLKSVRSQDLDTTERLNHHRGYKLWISSYIRKHICRIRTLFTRFACEALSWCQLPVFLVTLKLPQGRGLWRSSFVRNLCFQSDEGTSGEASFHIYCCISKTLSSK